MARVVVPFRADGQVVRRQPPGGLHLASGCDWGACDRVGTAWRWSEKSRAWLVVCARCIGKPVPAFVPTHLPCAYCDGSGRMPAFIYLGNASAGVACRYCNGTGRVFVPPPTEA